MKQRVRLTEGDLHRIVKESVRRIINELSDDTIDSARDAADKKVKKYSERYGEGSAPHRQAQQQRNNFSEKWMNTYRKANANRQARMIKNRTDRQAGRRKYENGKWRTNED